VVYKTLNINRNTSVKVIMIYLKQVGFVRHTNARVVDVAALNE